MIVAITLALPALLFSACSTGEIDNFEGIEIESSLRVSYVSVQIVLVDSNGTPLLWGSSILSPEVGLSALHPSEIIVEAEVYDREATNDVVENEANDTLVEVEAENETMKHEKKKEVVDDKKVVHTEVNKFAISTVNEIV